MRGVNHLCCGGSFEHYGSCEAKFTEQQPDPVPNDHPAVWDLVLEDMRQRDRLGQSRYGCRLQPHNGRDALKDAYDEALDLAAYLRAALFERDGK